MTGGMEIPRLHLNVRRRPSICLSPAIHSHDEEAHRRLIEYAVLVSLEPVVEPPQLKTVQEVICLLPEVPHAAKARPGNVDPRANDQTLGPSTVVPRTFRERRKVRQRPIDEGVVPAPQVETGDLDAVVPRFERDLLPVFVPGIVSEPVEKVLGDVGAMERRKRVQRLCPVEPGKVMRLRGKPRREVALALLQRIGKPA